MILDRMRMSSVLDILRLSQGNKVMDVSYFVRVVVDKDTHSVYFSTTDFRTFLVVDFGDVSLSILSDVPEEFLISFRQFHDIVRASTTENVTITGKENDSFVTVETNGKYRFHTYHDPSLFPVVDFDYNVDGVWEAYDLLDILRKVSISVSKDVTKLEYQGINFDGNWAASDNRRFSLVMGDDEHKYDGKSMLIPTVIRDIVACCSGEVKIGMNKGGNMVIIQNDERGLLGALRLIDSSFVSYQNLIDNRQSLVRVAVPKLHFQGALNRLSVFTDKLFKIANFSVIHDAENGDVVLRMCIENNDGGVEEVDAMEHEICGDVEETGGEIIASNYQIDNFSSGVGAVDSDDEVWIDFQKDGKLWIDEGNFHYLLSRITK